MIRLLVPGSLVIGVLAIGLTLIIVVTLRPWAGADASYHTHLNFYEVPPEDYTRTEFSVVGDEITLPQGWDLSSKKKASNDIDAGLKSYIARACASCHGIKGKGNASGPPIVGLSERKIRKVMKDGSGGMPVYHEDALNTGETDLLVGYIVSLGSEPIETPTPSPAPTPWPKPSATPSATPTRTPRPTYTPTPAPAGLPTPMATATPTPTPPPVAVSTATPLPKPDLSPEEFEAAKQLYIDVGCDICHGPSAEGNEKGPAVAGSTTDEIRTSVREGIRDPNSKYPREMKATDDADLSDEELQMIIDFLRSLD